MKKKSIEKSLNDASVAADLSQSKNSLTQAVDEDPLFNIEKHKRITLRLSIELAAALEKFVVEKSTKQRQKKKVIVLALENFLREKGYL